MRCHKLCDPELLRTHSAKRHFVPGKLFFAEPYLAVRTRILFPLITLCIVLSGFASSVYGAPFKGPWRADGAKKSSDKQPSSHVNPLRSLVEVYRNYVSPIDGKTCPMYPSCSQYSLLCFGKHGFLTGWIMTCDRLLHEADEIRQASVIYVNGAERFYDPLENNDFWWYSGR